MISSLLTIGSDRDYVAISIIDNRKLLLRPTQHVVQEAMLEVGKANV
jgi:hypothetical protein